MYRVEVDMAPAYELIISLYQYINNKSMKGAELGRGWVKEVNAQLPEELIVKLSEKAWEVLHRLSLLVWQCPGERTPEQFISWLGSISPLELYERMIPWVTKIPKDFQEVQHHLIHLLEEWHHCYFKQRQSSILPMLEHSAASLRDVLSKGEDPKQIVETYTNGICIEPVAATQRVLLIPQHHAAPYSIIDSYQGLLTCLYPVDIEEAPFLVKRVQRQLQALADKNRIYILKLLHEHPTCTFTEILHKTGLVKSNLHYHLSMLRTAGLIRAHRMSERIEFYSMRPEGLQAMQEGLAAYMKGERM
ncbi:ArsR/SmtB family transcription factor [Aneurinibacillus sp. REN35]|uniref:ArsR/SmtB family transcription factor n=1 Tax=Aneurinibacillus sp. REN35 TaxID=3237286 RepID=UPI003528AE18